MKIIIVGGGIGGLTTALCCARFGHDVTVLESATSFEPVGAGIQLPPNAMRVFSKLSLSKHLRRLAFEPKAIETRMGMSGRRIFRVAIDNSDPNVPYLHIHRADYISVLYEALKNLPPVHIRFNAKAVDYVNSDMGVIVTLSDGEKISSDLLVGADGIKSIIRTQMHGAIAADFTGHVAWRCTVPLKSLKHLPPPTACAWLGRGMHAVTYRIEGGKRVNFVGVIEQEDWLEESWNRKGDKADVLSHFKGWHPCITEILQSCDERKLYKWALYDRSPLQTWSQGAVTLLGDAAHPMLPFLAQGAAMAVEDAWCLAQLISEDGATLMNALQSYEHHRKARTIKVQKASTRNGDIFHKSSRSAQLMTYGPMWVAGKLTPSLIKSRLNWLYDYDIIAEMDTKPKA